MTPEDIAFILNQTEDCGTGMIRACAATGYGVWRELYAAGYPEITFGQLHLRRRFIEGFASASTAALAGEMLRGYLDRLPEASRRKFFATTMLGTQDTYLQVLVGSLDSASETTRDKLRCILDIAREVGADFSQPVKYRFKHNSTQHRMNPVAMAFWNGRPAAALEYLRSGVIPDVEAHAKLGELMTAQKQIPALIETLRLLVTDHGVPVETLAAHAAAPAVSEDVRVFIAGMQARNALDATLGTSPAP